MQWFSISVFETDDIGSNPILVAYVVFSLTGKVPPCDGVEQGSSPGDNRKEQLAYSLMEEHCATNAAVEVRIFLSQPVDDP